MCVCVCLWLSILPHRLSAMSDSVPVPASFAKKAAQVARLKARKTKAVTTERKARSARRVAAFRKAEKHVAEYRQAEKQKVAARRAAKKDGLLYREEEPKVAFAIRIRGLVGVPPKQRKILQLLRLRQINNGVFIKVNKATQNMLRLVEPYITYGYPSRKTIRELVYKRGFGKVNKQRVALTDNAIIEKSLGDKGLICVEDLIHELVTCGPNFKAVSNFFWPFKLNSPRGGFSYKKTHFIEGGDCGNREEEINKLIQRMN